MNDSNNATSTLNTLLETCRDAQNGFATAAQALEDPTLKAELMEYSRQREAFADELRVTIASIGETPNDGGSAAAALHRGWMSLKSLVTGSSPHAVLSECERGEDSAVETYREAMNAELPPSVLPVIQTQFEEIQHVHDRIAILRDTVDA